MTNIQQASPRARKKTLGVLLVGTCVGLALISAYAYFEADILRYLERNIEQLVEHSYLVFLFGLVLATPVFVACAYLFVYGQRAHKFQRMPPPGYDVVRDTQVFEGDSACAGGRLVKTLALILLLGASLIPLVLWYVFAQLLGAQ